ncbi:uncharacterized protein ACWYII_040684 [Salvelinus alpinus]
MHSRLTPFTSTISQLHVLGEKIPNPSLSQVHGEDVHPSPPKDMDMQHNEQEKRLTQMSLIHVHCKILDTSPNEGLCQPHSARPLLMFYDCWHIWPSSEKAGHYKEVTSVRLKKSKKWKGEREEVHHPDVCWYYKR